MTLIQIDDLSPEILILPFTSSWPERVWPVLHVAISLRQYPNNPVLQIELNWVLRFIGAKSLGVKPKIKFAMQTNTQAHVAFPPSTFKQIAGWPDPKKKLIKEV